jgi:hypothetical protein
MARIYQAQVEENGDFGLRMGWLHMQGSRGWR